MRRASTWILIIALILLGLCVLWLIPRLLQEPPPPTTDIASAARTDEMPASLAGEPGPKGTESTEATAGPRPGPEDADAKAAREDADRSRPQTGRIEGRLVDRSGVGIEGASVLAAHAPDLGTPIEPRSWWIAHLPLDVADPVALGAEAPRRAVSDGEGFFAFEEFEAGRVRLAVRSDRREPLDRDDLHLATGATISLGEIRLENASFLTGRISDLEGRPLSGAPLTAVHGFSGGLLPPLAPSAGVQVAVTDGRGVFRSSPMGRGPWTLLVPGGAELADVLVQGASPREGHDLRVSLGPADRIRGRVRSSSRAPLDLVVRALPAESSRSPVPFACRADAREAAVLRDRSFELRGIALGEIYEMRASSSVRPFELDSAWSPPALAAAGDEEVALSWEPDASVTFRLADARSRTAIVPCSAALAGLSPERASFDASPLGWNGIRTIDELRPLRFAPAVALTASSPGFLPLTQDLDALRPGYDLPLGDLKVDPVPTLLVRIADGRTGLPVRGARASATENPCGLDPSAAALWTASDERGFARIHSFGGTSSVIEARAPGYATARRYGPFGSGFSEATLEIGLVRGATVRVRVVDAAGEEVPGARVEHVEGNWSPNDAWRDAEPRKIRDRPASDRSKIADAKGVAVFSRVAPGRQAFRVQRFGPYLDGEWTLRELGDGEDVEIVLVSQTRAALEVRVLGASASLDGAPVALLRRQDVPHAFALADVSVELPPGLDARLDSRGACRFENLLPGGYLLFVGVEGQRLRASREVKLEEGGSRIDLDLGRRSVVGRVVSADGSPVAAAEIDLVPVDKGSERFFAAMGYAAEGRSHRDGLEHFAAISDDAGEFELLGLPLGESFSLRARAGEHRIGRSGPYTFGAGADSATAEIVLAPAGALEVRASARTDPSPCWLTAVPRGLAALPRFRRMYTGRAELLQALEPGHWEIVLGLDDGRRHPQRERVEVVAGETRLVEFALP